MFRRIAVRLHVTPRLTLASLLGGWVWLCNHRGCHALRATCLALLVTAIATLCFPASPPYPLA